MTYKWVLVGPVSEVDSQTLAFKGRPVEYTDPNTNRKHDDGGMVGQGFTDARYDGGRVSATIRFESLASKMAAGITLASNPMTGAHLTVSLGNGPFVAVRAWNPGGGQGAIGLQAPRWIDYAAFGESSNIEIGRSYKLSTKIKGSWITVWVDDVKLIQVDLRETLARLRAGIWFLGSGDIGVSEFKIVSNQPAAFVVMEFSQSFNDLYDHVIKPVCAHLEVKPIRADERQGPGMIVADIERQITESNLIIAEITPVNANVFYEVGYAHALKKPTILLAQRGTKLPFDVSGFRTIFYDNTIEGKGQVEEGLKKHLTEVLSPEE
ncbi:hypothetical protein AB4Y45_44880 [Paraburkholderia sp. EG287A]|uniref:hypothetical protein n=1 Tax=unclassified Paraburkholderia TaxID=2615204 RepID=UPI0034D2006D